MLVVAKDGSSAAFAIAEGFLEGGADHVNVIVQKCVAASDIDEADVRREFDRLSSALASLAEGDPEHAERLSALRWAEARLESISHKNA